MCVINKTDNTAESQLDLVDGIWVLKPAIEPVNQQHLESAVQDMREDRDNKLQTSE